MKVLRKFEEVCIHNLRETMLKKYRKSCKVLLDNLIFLFVRFNHVGGLDSFLDEHLQREDEKLQ
jgi:hypothetical protein